MTIKHSLLFILVLSCSLTKARQPISPLTSLLTLGLGTAFLYNLHKGYYNTKYPAKLLSHTAGALASGYLVGGLFQTDSSFSLGDCVASVVLAGSLISYKRPYPKLWTTTSAFGFGIMLKKLTNSAKFDKESTKDNAMATPSNSQLVNNSI